MIYKKCGILINVLSILTNYTTVCRTMIEDDLKLIEKSNMCTLDVDESEVTIGV